MHHFVILVQELLSSEIVPYGPTDASRLPARERPDGSYLCSRQEADLTAAKGSKTRHAELGENVDLKPYG